MTRPLFLAAMFVSTPALADDAWVASPTTAYDWSSDASAVDAAVSDLAAELADAGVEDPLGLLIEGATAEEDTLVLVYPEFPTADFSSPPCFSIGAADLQLPVSGDLVLNSLDISGTFTVDISYFAGGPLQGELDIHAALEQVLEVIRGLPESCPEDSGDDGIPDLSGLVVPEAWGDEVEEFAIEQTASTPLR